jgi:hypothetical protein
MRIALRLLAGPPGACRVPEGQALRPGRQAQCRHDGQVVRGAPCFVRANSDDLAQCPRLVHPNAVERKDWQTRRKASHGGTTAETPVKPAERSPPKKPFIDVAQKNGRNAWNASEQCKQALYLQPPFTRTQAKVGNDHAQAMPLPVQPNLERAPRFTSRDRQIVDVNRVGGRSPLSAMTLVSSLVVESRRHRRRFVPSVPSRRHQGSPRFQGSPPSCSQY